MKIELINDFSLLHPLRSEWNELLHNSYNNNAFLTYEWQSNWWSVFGDGKLPAVLLATDGGTLVGIAPLYLEYVPLAGPSRISQLCFLGDKFVGSDYLDFIVLRGREEELIHRFIDYLIKNLSWHRLSLRDMRENSPGIKLLQSLSKHYSLSFYMRRSFACPYLDMPGTVEEFIELPDSTFKKIIGRKTIPKLFKDFKVEIGYSTESKDLDEYLERLFDLFAERWDGYEWSGYLDDAKMRDFYKKASAELAAGGFLKLTSIKIDGVIEAMNYSLCFGDSWYYLLGGCSKRGLKLRAGNVLMFKTLEYLIGKIRVYNFLRGPETYKYSWGGVDGFTADVQMGRGRIGKLVTTYQAVKDKGKVIIKALIRKRKKEKEKIAP